MIEHRLGKTPGVQVIPGAVVAVRQSEAGKIVEDTVGEGHGRLPVAENRDGRPVGDAAQRQDHLESWHRFNFSLQIAAACGDFRSEGFVAGGKTADRVGDAAVGEDEAVVRVFRVVPRGKAVAEEGWIEDVAGGVAGERPPGAVGPVPPRCQANDEQPCVRFAKRRHRGVVPAGVFVTQIVPECREARAAAAGLGRVAGGFGCHDALYPLPQRASTAARPGEGGYP